MANAVTIVFQQSMFSREPARARVELGGEPIGIIECLEHRDVTVLVRIGVCRF